MLNNYKIVNFIGKGEYGETSKYINIQDGKFYAIKKFITKGEEWKNTFNRENEEKILKAIFSICKDIAPCFKEVIVDAGISYIVMEFINGWDLHNPIFSKNRLALDVRRTQYGNLDQDLIKAVYLLHGLGIIHQDIKAANIMYDLDSGHFKLIDFGLSCMLEKDDKGDVLYSSMFKNAPCGTVGTVLYSPPEMYDFRTQLPNQRGVYTTPYLKGHDIWSVGCMLFTWYGLPDNFHKNERFYYYGEQFDKNPKIYRPLFESIKQFSSSIYKKIIICFQRDPFDRIDAFENLNVGIEYNITPSWDNTVITDEIITDLRNLFFEHEKQINNKANEFREYIEQKKSQN